MRKPAAVGAAISLRRRQRWVKSFGGYRTTVTNGTIDAWLDQFENADRDLAARVLDTVEYYGLTQIYAGYRDALSALDGWHRSPSKREGEWRFAAMSGSAGESGDSMLHHFRVANQLDADSYDPLFVYRSDLTRQGLGENDAVVLIDDFSGTGNQVCKAWNDPALAFGELLGGVGRVYLVLVSMSKTARRKIKQETRLSVISAHELSERDNVFANDCRHFSTHDRGRLEHYGRVADKKQPRGYGDCGFVVVFQHRTPSNSIPILHADNARWTGLFPRHA